MLHTLGVIIALVIAILVAQDAKKRGMNAWIWGIVVFFVPIIGLLTYFIFRK